MKKHESLTTDSSDSEDNTSQVNNVEYNDDNILHIDYKKHLINCKDKSVNEILNLYKETLKKTKYSDNYRYLLSKIKKVINVIGLIILKILKIKVLKKMISVKNVKIFILVIQIKDYIKIE